MSRRPQVGREAVLTHWVGAALRGQTYEQAAETLGMTRAALRQAVCRARRECDPRAISNEPFLDRRRDPGTYWDERDALGRYLPKS